MREGWALLSGVTVGLLVSAMAGCASNRAIPVSGSGSADAASKAEIALQQALEHLPDGQSLDFGDDGGRASGLVVVERTFQNESGAYCRSFTQRLTDAGGTRTTAGTACRSAPGRWAIEPV
jgi:surface antigen